MLAGNQSQETSPLIELKTSDLYHRHKRNLILFSSATIALAFADRTRGLKIPGLDVSLSPGPAFAMLFLAVFYSAMQYLTEFRAVSARNAEGWAHLQVDQIDAAFKTQAEQINHSVARVISHDDRLNQAIGKATDAIAAPTFFYEENADSVHAFLKMFPAPLTTEDVVERVETLLKSRAESFADASKRHLEVIRDQGEKAISAAREAADEMKGLRTTSETLNAKFSRLSRSIHLSQRLGMIYLDGIVPAALASAALVACIFILLGEDTFCRL